MKPSSSELMSRHYPESRYGGYADIDGTVTFYTRVRSLIEPDAVVVDVGCGRGAFRNDPVAIRRELRMLKGACRHAIGIDVAEEGAGNPAIDEFRLIRGKSWPIEDASVDVCVCDWVVEHIESPRAFFEECARILKNGGYVCVRTLNIFSYVGLASLALPNRAHLGVLARVQPSREHRDVFRTFYRCNSRRKLKSVIEQAGFTAYAYGHDPDPTYLAFSPALYRVGVWHQRIAPRTLAVTLLAFGRLSGHGAYVPGNRKGVRKH